MLNPVAKEWVDVLRSGKYVQAHNQLGTVDGARCCLKEKGVISYFNPDDVFLPIEVAEWAGLNDETGSYGRDEDEELAGVPALWKDNDGAPVVKRGETSKAKRSFYEIADIIESEPKGLFR